MSYQRHGARAGRGAYIREYYSCRFHPKGASRQKRGRTSSASVRAANQRNAQNRLKWKLNENFDVGDYFVTLTYGGGRNRDVTWEEMQKDLTAFLRRLKYGYQKRGVELQYMAVPEVGKKGAKHFHLVLPAVDQSVIRRAWRLGFSNIKIVGEPADGRNVYDAIAEYMCKMSEKTRTVLGNENIKRYTCSRNLREPKEETKVLLRDEMNDTVRYVPKGYYLVPDTVVEYINEFGYLTREYLCLQC